MQLSTAAIKFWRPMAFEPLAGPKDVTAIVVYEDGGAELSGAVKGWLKRVTDAYQVRFFQSPRCSRTAVLTSLA